MPEVLDRPIVTEWDENVPPEEMAQRMADLATKLQESQPSLSLWKLMRLLVGSVRGESGREVQL